MKTNKILGYAFVAALGLAFLGSCSKSDSPAPQLPPIGGYNNAGEVGSADLIAYWSLDGNGIESKSNTAPTKTVGTTYEAGVKGQGAKLTAGFMKYPNIAALSASLTSFSVSAWVKAINNGTSGSVFLSLARPGEWAGNVNFMAETGWMAATKDSITFKGLLVSSNTLGWQDSRNTVKASVADIAAGHVANANKVGGVWAHAVITWDGATRLFKVYSNGVKISNPAWEQRGTADGTLLAFTTPTYPVIGAFGNFAEGTAPVGDTWNAAMTGSIDEMRVWKKALSATEIGSLYEIEKAGR